MHRLKLSKTAKVLIIGSAAGYVVLGVALLAVPVVGEIAGVAAIASGIAAAGSAVGVGLPAGIGAIAV